MDVIRSIYFICRNAPECSLSHICCCERQDGRVVSFIVLSVNGCRRFVFSLFMTNFVAGGELFFPCLLNRLKFMLMPRRTSSAQHVVVIDPHRVTPSYIYSHASLVHGSVELLTDLPSWYARRGFSLRVLRCGVWLARRLWGGAFHGLTAEQLLLSRWLRRRHTTVVLSEFGTSAADLLPVYRHAGVAVVPFFHGMDATRRDVVRRYRERYARLFAYARCVLCASPHLAERLRLMGCRVPVVSVPCLPSPFYYKLRATLAEPLFFFCGRFVEKKSPQAVLLAFAELVRSHPEARLVMAGDGPLRDSARQLAVLLGIDGAVSFPGWIDRGEHGHLLQTATAYVQHSMTAPDGDCEGTPVSVMEAMAAGVPVVSTRHAGIPFIARHDVTALLVDEGDYMAMARDMALLLEQPHTARRIGDGARRHMAEQLPKSREAELINDVLRDASRHV